jgi:hypothetical protein
VVVKRHENNTQMPYAYFYPDCEVLTSPKAEDIQRVAVESSLPGLIVFSYPFEDLQPLAPLSPRLRIFKVSGATHLNCLNGVESLVELRELVLSTPTGSTGSGRKIDVASLAPLGKLPNLERLVLQDVCPTDHDFSTIMRMSNLREFEISGVPDFEMEQYAELARALPNATGRSLSPYFVIKGMGFCRKCRGQQVCLVGTAPRARKWLCPTCNAKLFLAHVARWEHLTGRRYVPPNQPIEPTR